MMSACVVVGFLAYSAYHHFVEQRGSNQKAPSAVGRPVGRSVASPVRQQVAPPIHAILDTHALNTQLSVKGTEVIKSSAVFKNGLTISPRRAAGCLPFEMGYGFPSGKYSEYEFAAVSRKP